MAKCCLRRLSARRLARQYAIEMVRECEVTGCNPETVTPESVIERMEADGLTPEGVDWSPMVTFLLQLIEQLIRLFFPQSAPVMTTATEQPEKSNKAK